MVVPPPLCAALLLLPLLASRVLCQQNFTVSNGQIYTPGFAIVDSPQPGTPLGGSQIEVAIDVTANGILPLSAATDSPSRINNITMFMYSYGTGRNFTISNGTVANGTYGPIMQQEPSSTVKHVRWTWPSCLEGNGQPTGADSDRGVYNISIRQNFRLNDTDHYTIFDLPISVTNSIDNSTARPDCDSLNNPLMTPEQINATAADRVGVLFAPGDSQMIQVRLNETNSTASEPGLGGAVSLRWETGAMWMCGLTFVAASVV
ncbi:unnamed protein product [Discula destructiva]